MFRVSGLGFRVTFRVEGQRVNVERASGRGLGCRLVRADDLHRLESALQGLNYHSLIVSTISILIVVLLFPVRLVLYCPLQVS